MTVEQLERGQRLLKDIEEYEERLHYVENGLLIVRYQGCELELDEDIFRELILTQLRKDLNFLKERFDCL